MNFGLALRGLAQAMVEVDALPALQQARLELRQPGLHREIGLGQEQRRAPIARVGLGRAHG
jgi:hypothetical protein